MNTYEQLLVEKSERKAGVRKGKPKERTFPS